MKRRTALLVAVAFIGSSCGSLEMDTAATVDGSTILMSEVEDVASTGFIGGQAQQGEGLVSTAEGRAGGATARSALVFLVQNQIFKNGLASFGLDVPTQGQPNPEVAQNFDEDFVEYALYQQTLVDELTGALAALDPADEVERRRYFDAHESFFDQTCFEAVATTPEFAGEAGSAALGSETLADVATEFPEDVFPLGEDGSELCLNESGVPDELQAAVFTTDLEEIALAESLAQDRSAIIYLIRPNSRGQLQFSDESTQTQLDALFGAFAQGDVGQWFTIESQTAQVDVDARLGEWRAIELGQIEPPPLPVMNAPTAADQFAI